MTIDSREVEYPDPARLADAARTFLGVVEMYGRDGADLDAEEAMRHAYLQCIDDLETLERAEGDPAEKAERFGPQLCRTLAALFVVARALLHELAGPVRSTLDGATARRDLARYLEILARLAPPECLQELIDAAPPAEVGRVREILAQAPGTAPVPYLRLAPAVDELPCDGADGVCALVAAQHHLQQAFLARDLDAVKRWFAEGSPGAAREVLRLAELHLSAARRGQLLGELLSLAPCDPVRQAAAVLELGTLNLVERPEGGQAELNHLLVTCALTDDADRIALARLAIGELVTVRQRDALLLIAAHAPLLPVAEEAVAAMKNLRCLRLVEPLLRARPALRPAYRAAHQELVEIQNLVEAIWAASTADQVEACLDRLRALRAEPELDRLVELIERTPRVMP